MALAHELENGNNLKDNLFIDMNAESRWGHVRYGGEVINAKVAAVVIAWTRYFTLYTVYYSMCCTLI